MNENLEPLERLADMFRKLDGVGKRSAARYAYNILSFTPEEAAEFAEAIMAAKTEIHRCSVCCNITTGEVCKYCASPERDHSVICVVEDPRAVMAIEKTRKFRGVYHVLHGTISPMRGILPDMLTIRELLARLSTTDEENKVDEVIIATNPTVEGDATAMYLAKLIAPLGVKASRIANGVPIGAELEYADEVTLMRAMEGRYALN
ncbi:MAG: recombination protein RecR [Clostridia bacterium]|nr:recombination protein RecR [Clostridia bacterium]